MVEFMNNHSDLAKGHVNAPNARQAASALWNSLAEELNASGPPIREAAGWKKVWADYKVHTKQKLRRNKTDIGGTGGGPSKFSPLSPLEEQVAKLLNMEDSVNGLRGALSFGATTVSTPKKDDAVVIEPLGELPLQEIEVMADPIVSSQTSERNPRNLLIKQVSNQFIYQKECLLSLNKINESLKSLCRYQRKEFEIREKELDLNRKRFDFDKENEIEKRNLLKQKLELKKMLEIGEEKMKLM